MSSFEDLFRKDVGERGWKIAEQHDVSSPKQALGEIAMSMATGNPVEITSKTPEGERTVTMRFDGIYATGESIIGDSSVEAIGYVVADRSEESDEETSDPDNTPITVTFRRGDDNEVESGRFFL